MLITRQQLANSILSITKVTSKQTYNLDDATDLTYSSEKEKDVVSGMGDDANAIVVTSNQNSPMTVEIQLTDLRDSIYTMLDTSFKAADAKDMALNISLVQTNGKNEKHWNNYVLTKEPLPSSSGSDAAIYTLTFKGRSKDYVEKKDNGD